MPSNEPSFTILAKADHYQLRHYDSMLVAQTTIAADFQDASHRGFRILADYIFGNNQSQTKIAMNTPVTQQPLAEKITTYAPVNQLKSQDSFVIQFTLPKNFILTTIPKPIDARIHIQQIPPRTLAVYSYSGSWSAARYQQKLSHFLTELKKNAVHVLGEPIFARFNAPFTPWFLRRNEIWMEVAV